MITATVSGRITRDATLRDAGQSKVCSFGMASNKKVKGEDVTTFVDISIFGSRGEKLCQYLTKGGFVVASGELGTREHNGKTYVQLDAQSIEFGPKVNRDGASAGNGNGAGRAAPPATAPTGGGGHFDPDDFSNEDDIPFISNESTRTGERWWK